MINAGFATQGADKLAHTLALAAVGSQKAVDGVTRTFGQLLVTKVMAKASGRPGPNAPTGDYRRSWNVQWEKDNGATVANVGTNKPQGRRLEFGFHGVDSLGRHYDQPAYPHVWPAAQEIMDPYEKAVSAAVQAAI